MKDDGVYLADIQEAIMRIMRYAEAGRERFLSDELLQDAILRNFQVLGEAARRVSEEFRASHPELPWQDMIGMRNVIIHDYAELDLATLWETIVQDLPPVQQVVQKLAAA